MILEATRLWARALASEIAGVNTFIPKVPRDGDDPVPPDVEIFNWSQHAWAARMDFSAAKIPAGKAALVIIRAADLMETTIPGNPNLGNQQANVVLAAIYLGRVDASRQRTVDIAEQDASYTMRGVLRCTNEWIESAPPDERVMAQCRLVEANEHSLLTFSPPAGSGLVGQGVLFGVRMTDMYAENIHTD